MMMARWKAAAGLMMAAALAACSGTEGPQGPGPMLADNTCAQLRSDLNAMDKRGVPGMIDGRANGRKYAPAQDAEITRYNQVLDQYLGGQCASESRYKEKAGIRPSSAASSKRASVDRNDGITTASIPKSQVKRRKSDSDDDTAASVQDSEQAPAKSERKRTARSIAKTPAPAAAASSSEAKATPATASSATPAPTPVKADSGLPAAPAPEKSESKPESSEKKE